MATHRASDAAASQLLALLPEHHHKHTSSAALSSPTTTAVAASEARDRSDINTATEDLVFGSLAGCISKFIEFPFDTIKVRLQTQTLGKAKFNGPLDCLRKSLRADGLSSLYRGLSTPMVGAMLENAVLFMCYNHIQRLLRGSECPSDTPLSIPQLCLAGALSGSIVSLVLTPIELIKCQLQVSSARAEGFGGPLAVAIRNLRSNGISGFYRGHIGTFLRETGGGAAWFGTYETLCRWQLERLGQSMPGRARDLTKDDLGPAQLMLSGAAAGMAFNAILFPADVVKSQMQTEGAHSGTVTARRQRGFLRTTTDIWRADGWRGFYKGFGITVARSAPTNAVLFMSYELMSRNWQAFTGRII